MNVLKLGSKGEDVKTLQKALNITVDGSFGVNTERAVKQFQAKNKLVADGIVGNSTWNALNITKGISSFVIYKPLSVHITKCPNRQIEYLAIHYTAGSSSSNKNALATYNTFMSRQASADFCVDDTDIVQFNPDPKNYYCWAVGDSKKNSKGGSLYNKATNKNTISIEICSNCKPSSRDAVANPNNTCWSFSEASLNNAIKLSKLIMKTYNIPLSKVVRHYDITGKQCPGIIGWNDEPIYDITLKKITKNNSTSEKWLNFKNKLV